MKSDLGKERKRQVSLNTQDAQVPLFAYGMLITLWVSIIAIVSNCLAM